MLQRGAKQLIHILEMVILFSYWLVNLSIIAAYYAGIFRWNFLFHYYIHLKNQLKEANKISESQPHDCDSQ